MSYTRGSIRSRRTESAAWQAQVPKRRNAATADRVAHPRYGSAPIVSGLSVAEERIRRSHWRGFPGTVFPESVLIADASKQNYSIFPFEYYVDMLRDCRACHRPFIFFAREQRYWFETLRFFTDADCIHCPTCRRSSQALRRRIRRYSDLVRTAAPTNEQLRQLVDDAAYLLIRGALRRIEPLGRLKNLALKRIPDHAGTGQLADALARARKMPAAARIPARLR
jgi:Probable zinc-ribbon domain